MKKQIFAFGKASIIATNNTSARFTIDELKKIFEENNPTIFFNDLGACYYFMDFAFNKGKKTYWLESKYISGDFSKIEVNIYE